MQAALAYFIVLCAAIVVVRRYAPGFARRVGEWLRALAARVGWRIAEPPRAKVVMKMSPEALKRTGTAGKNTGKG